MTAPDITPDLTPEPAAVAENAPDLPLRLIGVLLAVLVTDPAAWFHRPPVDLVLPLLAGGAAWFAAVPVTARPVATGFRWRTRLARHRNSAFAVGCVLLAAANPPPVWLAGCETALLLSYLIALDAVTAGPPAARLLRRPLPLLAAYAASAAVFAAALLPVAPAGGWSRLVAAVALAGAGAALLAALAARRR